MIADTETKRHWQDLITAISREGNLAGGYGELIVSITFHGGQPHDLKILDRKPHYRLGGGLWTKDERAQAKADEMRRAEDAKAEDQQ